MPMSLAAGLWIPLITPFYGDAVDHAALAALVERLSQEGIAGFVACGSTGEAAALHPAEQLAVLDTVLAHAHGLPVVMGLSGYHLEDTRAWVRALCAHRAPGGEAAAGLLVPPPHYIRPSQEGVAQWFTALADVSELPVILYDIPARTGVALDADTQCALARHPHIVAVKDCGNDPVKTQRLIEASGLQVFAGDDARIFSTVAQGGHGAIAASAHVFTDRFVQIIALLHRGELEAAHRLWQTVQPWIEAAFGEPNPAPVKAALAELGAIHNGLRAPMTPASAAHTLKIAQCLAIPTVVRPEGQRAASVALERRDNEATGSGGA